MYSLKAALLIVKTMLFSKSTEENDINKKKLFDGMFRE
jgi:hypothetical protein